MNKTLCTIILLFALLNTKAQSNLGRLLDWPMKLKTLDIKVTADAFTATTNIEMEFCNPNNKEIEGLYQFYLLPGQVITAFQLDLNGNFREGTIEEKWKARNAYNTIVGKRIDPALLQMDYPNHYRLNIYPIPANGCRKIKFTIEQLLKIENDSYIYNLPLKYNDTIANLKLQIELPECLGIPKTTNSILEQYSFKSINHTQLLQCELQHTNYLMSNSISFTVPFISSYHVYQKSESSDYHFVLNHKYNTNSSSNKSIKKVGVFWDVSASAKNRNIKKEIEFLKKYILDYQVEDILFTQFNHKIVSQVTFKSGNKKWINFINNLDYEGATRFDILDFKNTEAEVILLFSDGINTFGKIKTNEDTKPFYCINTSNTNNISNQIKLIGISGGSIINLLQTTLQNATLKAGETQIWLLNVENNGSKISYNQNLPLKMGSQYLLTGTIEKNTNATLVFGTKNNSIKKEIKYDRNLNCGMAISTQRIEMLQKVEALINNNDQSNWTSTLDFGLEEKIVTMNTSYIVLERIEDYIKYNIAPPQELAEACAKLGYVKKDSKIIRQQLKQKEEFDIINDVVKDYNKRITEHGLNMKHIQFDKVTYESKSMPTVKNIDNVTNPENVNIASLSNSQSNLNDVVVVAYGTSKKMTTGSVTTIRQNQLQPGSGYVSDMLAGRVAGMQVTSPAQPGSAANIKIRGISSLSNNSQPLYVLDGIIIDNSHLSIINPNDIENITVLKDAASSALYGSRGANGTVIINSKKGKNTFYDQQPYKLVEMEDVEYMLILKETPSNELLKVYKILKLEHATNPGFFIDVASFFYQKGLKKEAMEILIHASEAADGKSATLKAIALVMEGWANFNEAINIYNQLIEDAPSDISVYRSLAWAYFQNNEYQKAVDELYKAIQYDFKQNSNVYNFAKSSLLQEMNAIIAIHKSRLDLSKIPTSLINPMLFDLRIVADANVTLNNFKVIEPKMKAQSLYYNYNWDEYWNRNQLINLYETKTAKKGIYSVKVYYYNIAVKPAFVRLMVFKNFGKPNQSIEIKHIILDNQRGEFEIGSVIW